MTTATSLLRAPALDGGVGLSAAAASRLLQGGRTPAFNTRMTATAMASMRSPAMSAMTVAPTDPPSKDALSHPPRRTDEPILGRPEWTSVVTTGVVTAACSLAVFVWALSTRDEATARNLAFSTLVFGQIFRAFAARSADKPLFKVGVLRNLWLLLVVVISVALQLGIHHLPVTQALFGVQALSLMECALSVGVGLVPVTVIELQKLLRRALRRSKA